MRRAPPIRVLVLNDYAVVAAGVVAMLRPFGERVAVITAKWAEGRVAPNVDIVLYDSYAGPAVNHAAVYAAFRGGSAKLVVYSWFFETSQVDRALAAGAVGYLSKRIEPLELMSALELICAGQLVVPTGLRTDRVRADGGWPGPEIAFSTREAEIVTLIALGLSNREIATRTFLSINSVKTYVRNAYRKMQVNSRPQAVLWALAHGFATDG